MYKNETKLGAYKKGNLLVSKPDIFSENKRNNDSLIS